MAGPLGGSWFVERLTDEIEATARGYLEEIDRRGGMVAAVEEGYPQAEIAEASYRLQLAHERGERVTVGVNRFAGGDGAGPPVHRADGSIEADQVARVRALRAARDPEHWAAARGALDTACRGSANTMPAMIDCANAGATMGEICDVFRSVWGSYRDPAHW